MSEDEKRERTAPRPLGLLEVLRRVHDGRLTVDEAVFCVERWARMSVPRRDKIENGSPDCQLMMPLTVQPDRARRQCSAPNGSS